VILLTVPETAALLRVSQSGVRVLERTGELRSVRIGKRVLSADVYSYLGGTATAKAARLLEEALA